MPSFFFLSRVLFAFFTESSCEHSHSLASEAHEKLRSRRHSDGHLITAAGNESINSFILFRYSAVRSRSHLKICEFKASSSKDTFRRVAISGCPRTSHSHFPFTARLCLHLDVSSASPVSVAGVARVATRSREGSSARADDTRFTFACRLPSRSRHSVS